MPSLFARQKVRFNSHLQCIPRKLGHGRAALRHGVLDVLEDVLDVHHRNLADHNLCRQRRDKAWSGQIKLSGSKLNILSEIPIR